MQMGGVSELSVRLPSLLVTLATFVAAVPAGGAVLDVTVARLATLACASAPLMWVDAGAVITDPFLTLGVTLQPGGAADGACAANGILAVWFFVGLAIGLLAKGRWRWC